MTSDESSLGAPPSGVPRPIFRGKNNVDPARLLVLCDRESDRQLFLDIKRFHASLVSIPDNNIRTYEQARNILNATKLQKAIQPLHQDDRPDFIFCYDDLPVLVTELTDHGYTGDNGLQRFARFAAAAENGVPFIYFGPLRRVRDDELDGLRTASPRSLTSDVFEGMERLSAVHDVPQLMVELKTDSNGMPARLPARFSKQDVLHLYGDLLDTIALLVFVAPLRTLGEPLSNPDVAARQQYTARLAKATNTRSSEVKFALQTEELTALLMSASSIIPRMAATSYFTKGKPDKILAEYALKKSRLTAAQMPDGSLLILDQKRGTLLVEQIMSLPKFRKPVVTFYTGYKWRSDPHCGVLVNMDYRLCRAVGERYPQNRSKGLVVIYPRVSLNSRGSVWPQLNRLSGHVPADLSALFRLRYGSDAQMKMDACLTAKNLFGLWKNSSKQARLFRRYADVIILNDGIVLGDSLASLVTPNLV